MKVCTRAYFPLLLICLLLNTGLSVHAVSYDYSATLECLAEPRRAHYGGGIIANPEFHHSIENWTVFGKAVVEERVSKEGNRFIAALNRSHPLDSFSQKVRLHKESLYSFSAWVQLGEGSETVSAIFRTNRGEVIRGGKVVAHKGCWTLLKGGMVSKFSSSVDILFESKNTTVEIWVDSVSLQQFTKEQWKSHQDASIEKVRKSKVRLQVTDTNETALGGATFIIKQTKLGFPFGVGINHHILESTDYQNWFLSRFKYTTFTNEMKWYSTEAKKGKENYTIPDAMLKFAKDNGVAVRGHNIFWDNPDWQPDWVKTLPPTELQKAAEGRMKSVVLRYKGELIHWDVVNENLHFRFFEDKLGENASAVFYSEAYQLDPNTIMFMNEYNTIEDREDGAARPIKYKKKLEEILSFPGTAGMKAGIGLQGHFIYGQPNIAYMRSALDALATTGLPIWLTEVSMGNGPNQAKYFEDVLREGYSHPAVDGIITFAGPATAGFNDTVLVDENFKNTPAGNVVDKLLKEWKSGPQEAKADCRGFIDISLFHGEYDVTIIHPSTKSSKTMSLSVRKDFSLESIHVEIQS